MNPKRLLLAIIAFVACLHMTAQDERSSSSMFLQPNTMANTTVPFYLQDPGVKLPIRWGLDAAWINEQNIRKGINHIGKENLSLVRACFRTKNPLTNDSVLTSDHTAYLQRRMNLARLVGDTVQMILNEDQEAGIDFEFIDFGGGVGIPYTPDEELLDLEHFAEENVKLFKEKLEEFDMGEPTLYLEPGRYIVGDASVILVEVNSVKESYRKFIGVDAGFNTLLRPAMYDSYHHIVVANKMNEEPTQEVDVAGNVCESGDLFARDRPLPDIEEGDILGILNVGAYGYTMASNYNSRPLPAEILVKNGESFVIREAQSFDDIFEKQSIPDHLQ